MTQLGPDLNSTSWSRWVILKRPSLYVDFSLNFTLGKTAWQVLLHKLTQQHLNVQHLYLGHDYDKCYRPGYTALPVMSVGMLDKANQVVVLQVTQQPVVEDCLKNLWYVWK